MTTDASILDKGTIDATPAAGTSPAPEVKPTPDQSTTPEKTEPTSEAPGTKDGEQKTTEGGVDWNVSGPFWQKKYQELKSRMIDEPEKPAKTTKDEEFDPTGIDLNTAEGAAKFSDSIVERVVNKVAGNLTNGEEKKKNEHASETLIGWAEENKVPPEILQDKFDEIRKRFPHAPLYNLVDIIQEGITVAALREVNRREAKKRAEKDEVKVTALKKVQEPLPGSPPEPKKTEEDKNAAMKNRFGQAGKSRGAAFLSGDLR